MSLRKKLIGDRDFYRRLLAVMVPVLIQNIISNFVNLLDNVMVGRVGTEPMSGVAIANQLIFVYNLCLFAGTAGAGIFTAQFYGKGDNEGVRNTFRAKIVIVLVILASSLGVLLTMGDELIMLFLHEGEESLDLAATFSYAKDYIFVIYFQMLPFAMSQVYASTMRETGETAIPMRAGIAAVLVNLFFNWVLIFGKLGAPAMGVVGAAVATVISRFVELAILMIKTHGRRSVCAYAPGIYSRFGIPRALVRPIAAVTAPLLLNELLWSSGMTFLNQCYSLRGLEVVSACNISTTVSNLFFCAFFAMGTTVSIMVGQRLGAGEIDLAVEEDTKLIAFSVLLSTAVGALLALLCPYIPRVYNTTDTVKALASSMLLVSALMMPFNALTNCCYFTLRSGGKTIITFIFDAGFLWLLMVPTAFILSRYTDLRIMQFYPVVQGLELLKVILGIAMLRSRRWAVNLTNIAEE